MVPCIRSSIRYLAIALAAASLPAWSGDYVGVLKPPKSSLTPGGFLTVDTGGASWSALNGGDNGFRLKLGYKHSRYFTVQGEYVDFGRNPADIFASPGNLASAFRNRGYGIDTVATVPVWRSFSFYGRFGAYRGEARNAFAAYSTSLLGDTRSTRLRYGLGMRYDFTKAFGIRAELERYSPLGASLGSDADAAELVSVGVSWRF
jgi:OOP family OmpA-OmpF porin